jgi:hypothetical protein
MSFFGRCPGTATLSNGRLAAGDCELGPLKARRGHIAANRETDRVARVICAGCDMRSPGPQAAPSIRNFP